MGKGVGHVLKLSTNNCRIRAFFFFSSLFLSFSFIFLYNFMRSVMDLRVGNKYRIGRKIGAGSFGDIYLGNHE